MLLRSGCLDWTMLDSTAHSRGAFRMLLSVNLQDQEDYVCLR